MALALWPIDDTVLLLLFFYDSSICGGDVHGDVFCACEAALAVFVLFFFNHCILGERAWDIWTFMT